MHSSEYVTARGSTDALLPEDALIRADDLPDYAEGIATAESQFPMPTPTPAAIAESRGQVVTAATARMVNEPLGVLSAGLNPSRFDSWMPGLRRKAYRYFPSTTDLVHEVLAEAVDPERSEATDQLIHAMTEAAESLAEPLEVARVLPTAYVDRLRGDHAFRLEITAWLVMQDSPSLRDDLDHLHQSLIDRGAEGLQAVLQSYGLDVRSPLTWNDFATMLLAMVQGTVLRSEVAGDDYDPEVLVHAVMGLVMGLTHRPDTDARTMDDAYLDHVVV